jgi:hypothetical protein
MRYRVELDETKTKQKLAPNTPLQRFDDFQEWTPTPNAPLPRFEDMLPWTKPTATWEAWAASEREAAEKALEEFQAENATVIEEITVYPIIEPEPTIFHVRKQTAKRSRRHSEGRHV